MACLWAASAENKSLLNMLEIIPNLDLIFIIDMLAAVSFAVSGALV